MNVKNKIMTAEELEEELTRKTPQRDEFCRNDVTIIGKLNLRHEIIPVAITMTNCTFTDEVDLRYCEFKQCVDFSGSRFKRDFDSSKTIYCKDLIFNEAIFKGNADFNSLRCEKTGYFENAKFEHCDKEVNFVHARFGINLECQKATFQGGAKFNSLKCEENGFFYEAKFENTEKEIDFEWAMFGANLDCNEAIFKGGAKFNNLQCEGAGYFHKAKFENDKKKIEFAHAKFGGNLEFGNNLVCKPAIFKGEVNFYGLQCKGTGMFHKAKFENDKKKVDFTHARFDDDLECQEMSFAGEVDFSHIQISGRARLWETKFQNSVNFNCATIHNFSLGNPETGCGFNSFPFEKKDPDVDLRRFTFDIFEGTREQQEHIVKAQSPKKFTIDPYLQFERYYRSIGDEAYAKKLYYEGRRDLRKKALNKENPEIRWSWWKKITDWVLCWTVGYGVKMWLALLWIFVFLCVGTAVFWSDNALAPKDNALAPKSAEGIGAIKSVVEQFVKSDEPEQTGVKDNLTKLGHRLWYSLDLFIPIVDLQIVDGYRRFHGCRAVYGVFHIMMGWILVPLLIASLSGVVKK